MLYMANIHTVVVLEQNKEYSTDPISVSLAFCCIVVLSQEKRTETDIIVIVIIIIILLKLQQKWYFVYSMGEKIYAR